MKPRKQSFVEFLSPGTFVAETTERPIETWDIKTACKMAIDVTERYGSKPYGFIFHERLVAGPIDDGNGGTMKVQPKHVRSSGTHFINGVVLRFEEVTGKENDILRSNMRGNDWPLVCETRNSWRHMAPFNADDVVVTAKGEVIASGADAGLAKYRASRIASWKAEREREMAAYRRAP